MAPNLRASSPATRLVYNWRVANVPPLALDVGTGAKQQNQGTDQCNREKACEERVHCHIRQDKADGPPEQGYQPFFLGGHLRPVVQ